MKVIYEKGNDNFMKKILTTLLIAVFIFMVTSCDMNQNGKYLVEFITNTDSKITNQIVEKKRKNKKAN